MSNALVEQKLASLQAWVTAGLAFLFVTAVGGFLAAAYITNHQRADLRHSIEKSDQALSCYVTSQLLRAKTTIPTLAYYKQNPRELSDQLILIDQQITQAQKTWGICDTPSPA